MSEPVSHEELGERGLLEHWSAGAAVSMVVYPGREPPGSTQSLCRGDWRP